MGRKPRPNEKRKPQRQKGGKNLGNLFPVNNMSDKHFEKGDRDGGYDNWIPVENKNIPVDKTQLLNTANASVLIPKQKRDKKRY
jgi:hypothetical protein